MAPLVPVTRPLMNGRAKLPRAGVQTGIIRLSAADLGKLLNAGQGASALCRNGRLVFKDCFCSERVGHLDLSQSLGTVYSRQANTVGSCLGATRNDVRGSTSNWAGRLQSCSRADGTRRSAPARSACCASRNDVLDVECKLTTAFGRPLHTWHPGVKVNTFDCHTHNSP